MKKSDKLALYAVTDRSWLKGTLSEAVLEAILGGVTFLQLREKHMTDDNFVKEAQEIKKITDKYNIPFVINDNVDVALAVNADGVHVGQSDMEALDVRKRLGNDKIIGVSVQTVEQALLAQKQGADYLGVGAVFSTSTKTDASEVSFNTLSEICAAVNIPVVAIGGITNENIMQLKGSGICGVAVVSAIFAQENIGLASKDMLEKINSIL